MQREIEVELNWEDIQEAILDNDRGSSRWCPISRAVRRQTDYQDIMTSLEAIYIEDDKKNLYCYHLPEEALDFIWEFDQGGPVEPISFKVVLNGA